MTAMGLLQLAIYLGALLALAWPLGYFVALVYDDRPHALSWLSPVERLRRDELRESPDANGKYESIHAVPRAPHLGRVCQIRTRSHTKQWQ
jgi:hypothetical protein